MKINNLILGTGFVFSAVVIFSIPRISHKPAVSILEEKPLIEGLRFTEHNKKNKVFSIKADRFYLRNKSVRPFNFRVALGKSAELENVEVTFYKGTKPVSYLNSKSAIMDIRKKDIIFEGRPSLVTEDRNTLTAKKFVWNNFKNRLDAKGACVLGKEGRRYFGDVVNTDIELKDFTIVEEKEDVGFLKLKGRR